MRCFLYVFYSNKNSTHIVPFNSKVQAIVRGFTLVLKAFFFFFETISALKTSRCVWPITTEYIKKNHILICTHTHSLHMCGATTTHINFTNVMCAVACLLCVSKASSPSSRWFTNILSESLCDVALFLYMCLFGWGARLCAGSLCVCVSLSCEFVRGGRMD